MMTDAIDAGPEPAPRLRDMVPSTATMRLECFVRLLGDPDFGSPEVPSSRDIEGDR